MVLLLTLSPQHVTNNRKLVYAKLRNIVNLLESQNKVTFLLFSKIRPYGVSRTPSYKFDSTTSQENCVPGSSVPLHREEVYLKLKYSLNEDKVYSSLGVFIYKNELSYDYLFAENCMFYKIIQF